MYRKLLTALVSACALAAVLVGPASASAATLSLNLDINPTQWQSNTASFNSSSTTVTTSFGSSVCDDFDFRTVITQNVADPVTLEPFDTDQPDIDDCDPVGGATLGYSNGQTTGPVTFNANGTGTLPLRFTETWAGSSSCVRQGSLSLAYTPNQTPGVASFDGYLPRVTGACPATARFQGTFYVGDDAGYPIHWVVTP